MPELIRNLKIQFGLAIPTQQVYYRQCNKFIFLRLQRRHCRTFCLSTQFSCWKILQFSLWINMGFYLLYRELLHCQSTEVDHGIGSVLHWPMEVGNTSLSDRWKDYRGVHLRKFLRPRSHRIKLGNSRDALYKRNLTKHGHHVNTVHDIRVTHTSKFAQKVRSLFHLTRKDRFVFRWKTKTQNNHPRGFPSPNQVDSDFAIALALHQQERAFSMLETIESDDSEEYVSEASYENNTNDYEYFEGLEAEGDLELLEGQDSNDDEYMENEEDEIDMDDLSYDELIALGDILGVKKRGLSQNETSSCLIPCKFKYVEYKTGIDRCVICQVEYEEEESLVALPNCEHPYHSECINKWLQIKKICPICSTEISPSKNIDGNV
ncbi:hypothetical protein CRYUN_Cryun35bG0069600 [Craigia yunnanensis]